MVTGLLGFQMLATGLGDFILAEQVVENITHVGFPITLIPFLGVLKIMGALVLLFVGNLHLKIATYASMFFYAMGAIYSHIAIGDPIFPNTIAGIVMLSLITISYYFWQKHNFPFKSKIDPPSTVNYM
ncbi:MAG: DoxX family protein [Bacteroidota bacterium]